MAYPNIELVNALRETANRLKKGAYYAWGNQGACNCGNLIQSVTALTKEEIVRYSQAASGGEWTELAVEYCGQTNAPIDLIMIELEKIGLTPTDIHNLEYLSDREVLDALPGGFRWLKKNLVEDAIVYFETFAMLLEEKLISDINISYHDLIAPPTKKKSPILQTAEAL
jgi:hypothetical protein